MRPARASFLIAALAGLLAAGASAVDASAAGTSATGTSAVGASAIGASAAGTSVGDAWAQIAWKPCGNSNEVACGHLTVPLDPSGVTAGTITLALRRHRAPVGEARDAVIALAGGPGQSAIPFIGDFAQILGPIAATRDLIAFDQRGTGLSHALSCPAFEHLRGGGSPATIEVCAGQIGATRGLYTTAQTVADIEAIRQAGGYEKLVLYGTSYGTKVAERYAQEHPTHVEALVLDSVVPPAGPEPFDETSFAAVGRILRQLCAGDECARITHEPVGDLAALVRRMGGGQLRGRVVDEDGVTHPARISSNDLVGILLEGDFDPILRSEFPAAVRSAREGDTAALARLLAHAEGSGDESESPSEGFDAPLYYSTVCDETPFPWNGKANPRTRLHEARAALGALPASAFAPFTRANALALSDAPACSAWPFTPEAPEAAGPLPDVPTLILSGADDLRTPTANARAVAAQIPDAQLLVVPNTGHSVLGSDPGSCAHDALQAFFAGKPVERCRRGRPPRLLLPTPLPPRNIDDVRLARGEHGRVGRTVGALALTIDDFERQLLLAVLEHGVGDLFASPSVRTGGLRAGWGGLIGGRVVLHGYSYVPGVTVSGHTSPGGGDLRIGGAAAVHGTLTVTAEGALTGALDGRRVRLSQAELGGLGLRGPASALRARARGLL
jgi:pimeloyl-ACP methyl ester carboxylesterase